MNKYFAFFSTDIYEHFLHKIFLFFLVKILIDISIIDTSINIHLSFYFCKFFCSIGFILFQQL
ncbi:hypothetical protein COJ67_22690 [Bacillus thuringiensis]|nr:hypothetical protein BK703_04720 [Bacillus thuringiensis serovar silo]OTW61114.1 hypothetical protein BK700_23150 [Bacillus thuringiensis serovar toguchini]PDX93577.1 hypothetical protein COM78_17625 [Bacillus thuringiensis]PFK68048.1 hypothetical protein COJ13_22760 [Bacillus cereus]PDZ59020.1 hypothetical protein CON29_25545 [Bacillus thuringiensis]